MVGTEENLMYFIILSVSSSDFRFISLVEAKFLCEHFIGQHDILIYDPESTVKSIKEVPNTSPCFIGSKILNKMLSKKKENIRKKKKKMNERGKKVP